MRRVSCVTRLTEEDVFTSFQSTHTALVGTFSPGSFVNTRCLLMVLSVSVGVSIILPYLDKGFFSPLADSMPT